MAIEFKLPNLGENIESGDVVNVLVKEGDEIKANQGVLEIETDKAVIEVPTTQGGRVSKVHIKAGQTIKIGATVLTLESASSASSSSSAQAPPSKQAATANKQPAQAAAKEAQPKAAVQGKSATAPTAKQQATAPTQRPAPAAAPSQPDVSQDGNGRSPSKRAAEPATTEAKSTTSEVPAPAGPEVRRLARELGVDLARVSGSGGGGRITREDVIAAVRQANLTVRRSARATKRRASTINTVRSSASSLAERGRRSLPTCSSRCRRSRSLRTLMMRT